MVNELWFMLSALALVLIIEWVTLREKIFKEKNLLFLLGKLLISVFLVNTFFTIFEFGECFIKHKDNSLLEVCYTNGFESIIIGVLLIALISTVFSFVYLLFHRSINKSKKRGRKKKSNKK